VPQERIKGLTRDLLAAEAKFTVVAEPKGKQAVLIFSFSPAIHTGTTPGLEYQFFVPWKWASQFAGGLLRMAQRMRGGEGVVPGREYGRHLLNLPGNARLLVFLTADDCETLAAVIEEAVTYATEKPGIDIIKSLPKLHS
jgi:hypothetical protein